jgi:hypothetical protein
MGALGQFRHRFEITYLEIFLIRSLGLGAVRFSGDGGKLGALSLKAAIDAFVPDDAAGGTAGPEKLAASGTGETDFFPIEPALSPEIFGKSGIGE